ncbi:MAG: biotin--[acetyl-CoA-carboxylase] ligase [Emcibacter sp.]|nr:biotin--[acetyl-CoA-carboxylase] ligase [Emcibacter sp.]
MTKPFSMPEGYDLRAFDILDSTNVECRRIADTGVAGNIWVTAKSQTMGKGRRGRSWVSDNGNLFASLLYAIDCDLATASEISFVTALAVRDVVADIVQDNDAVACKWPNDILVRGKKISGILLETAGRGNEIPTHVIIGIGINITDHPEVTLYPATDLKSCVGRDVALDTVMQNLITSMDHWLCAWKDRGFSVIRKAWKENSYGMGEGITVRLPNEVLEGRFVDLDDHGALILEFNGERRHITAGDIFFEVT